MFAVGNLLIQRASPSPSSRHFTIAKPPCYNSFDANVTYLLSPKIIVYTSLNNLFGHTNIFRYDTNGKAVIPSRDRFLYIGIFVSLKSNKAYDISNF